MNVMENLVSIQPELFRFATKLTTNESDARDLLQETSLKVLDNKSKYTPDTNFKGWTFTIMRNLFVNNYRRIARKHLYEEQTEEDFVSGDVGLSVDDFMESLCDVKEMYRIIEQLNLEYKQPFLMYVAGYKYYEISERLSLPLGTVKSRIFFARQQLKNMLRDFN